MKKIILSVLSFLVILSSPLTIIHAQESTAAAIQYKLPYPGILPDNTLYKLKVLRDKIMLFLISDTNKKAEYYLLLANKQFGMSKQLVDKGNLLLAKDTALKAENQITLMTFAFKKTGLKPQANFVNEVKLASMKHKEILGEIISKVSADDATIFSTIMEFSQRNIDELQNLTIDKKEQPPTN